MGAWRTPANRIISCLMLGWLIVMILIISWTQINHCTECAMGLSHRKNKILENGQRNWKIPKKSGLFMQ